MITVGANFEGTVRVAAWVVENARQSVSDLRPRFFLWYGWDAPGS